MLITKNVVQKDELPYRISMDDMQGAGVTPDRAVMAALSAAGEIPAGLRDPKQAARHIFQKHQPSDWIEIIRILIEDEF